MPNVFPVPAAGGLTIGPSGTADPGDLAAAQLFDVQSVSAWDVAAQRWWVYIPGAPERVNAASVGKFQRDSFTWIKRRAGTGAPTGVSAPDSFAGVPSTSQALAVPPERGMVIGFAGTNDPAEVAASQQFEVRSISVFEVDSQRWLTFVPGAPSSVNSLTSQTLDPGAVVFVSRQGALATQGPGQVTQTSGSAFIETWDGDPAAPKLLGGILAPAHWDVQINDADPDRYDVLEMAASHAHHQANCGNPFHDGSGWHAYDGSYEATMYQCKNHLMTYLGHEGYTAIYMTPNQLIDLRGGGGVVRFDISTLYPQSRDWVDLWITPWDESLVLPLNYAADNFQGPPRTALHIMSAGDHNNGGFRLSVVQNYVETKYEELTELTTSSLLPDCTGPNDPSTTCGPSAKNRQTVEVVLSNNNTHIKVWMPEVGVVWYDQDIPQLNWDVATVQWGHHRYNAKQEKGCSSPISGQECSNTWHWDNHTIDPAIPFTMIKATQRVALDGQTVTLAAPAPANAALRFSGIGRPEVSYDGGPFQLANRRNGGSQEGVGPHGNQPHQFSNYWTPIPEGTQTVTFRFSSDAGYNGPFRASGIAVWSR